MLVKSWDDYSDLLGKIGDKYIAQLRTDLKAEGHHATGKLSNSIYKEIVGSNIVLIKSSYTNELGLLGLSEGRKSTIKNPSEEMVSHISEWMRKKGMSHLNMARVRKGSKGAGRFKAKKASSTIRSRAYGFAKGLLLKGYKGSGTIDRSWKKMEKTVDKDILEAFKLRINEQLRNITIS